MAQLLSKMKVRAEGASVTLMKIIKNPVTMHLPIGLTTIGTSSKAKLVDVNKYVRKLENIQDKPFAFVIGAVSIGNPAEDLDYINDNICISQYGLSAACCCSKITTAFERVWGIL